MVEWLAPPGAPAATLALTAAATACRAGKALVIVDPSGEFYVPGIKIPTPAIIARSEGMASPGEFYTPGIKIPAPATIAPHNARDLAGLMVLIRPSPGEEAIPWREQLWALDQALRCPGVGAVWCPVSRLDSRAGRRLQLAAEAGETLGVLVRPPAARDEPSWAEARLWVEPLPGEGGRRRFRVELLRCRGGMSGGAVELELGNETGALRVVPEVAHPTMVRRST
jgi:hypothetical protein